MSSHLRQLPFFRLGLSFWSGIASLADPLGKRPDLSKQTRFCLALKLTAQP